MVTPFVLEYGHDHPAVYALEALTVYDMAARVITPFYPVAGRGRRPYPAQTMLRAHLMQNWFGLSDPAMEEALYEISSMRKFASLTLQAIPDETTILNFRRLIETNELAPMLFDRVEVRIRNDESRKKRHSMMPLDAILATHRVCKESPNSRTRKFARQVFLDDLFRPSLTR